MTEIDAKDNPLMVDNRTGSIELIRLFPPGLKTRAARLSFGDFAFFGNGPRGVAAVGCERKTLPDFLGGLERFSGHQLPGLRSHYEFIYLLIEGTFRRNLQTGLLETLCRGSWTTTVIPGSMRRFMAAELDGALNTINIFSGVNVVFACNQWESVSILSTLYRWWLKPWLKHKAHVAFDPGPRALTANIYTPSLVAQVAKELPGVGWERARLLAKKFATVVDLVNASEADFLAVEGIGKGLAQNIIAALEGRKLNGNRKH